MSKEAPSLEEWQAILGDDKPMTIKQLRLIEGLIHSNTSRYRLRQALERCIQEINRLSKELETAD